MIEVVRSRCTSPRSMASASTLLAPATRWTRAGLVMIHEIFGINLPLREIAARFATESFAVLTVDVFSRMERNLDLDYDDDGHAKGRAMHKAFDYATGVKDLQAASRSCARGRNATAKSA